MTSITPVKSPRTRFPDNLTDLSRFRSTVHGPHDGTSRIVMVRKTDQRTFASLKKGEEPKLETITRETIETFRGQRTEYKVTTEKKDEEKPSEDLILAILGRNKTPQKTSSLKKRKPGMDFEQQCLEAHNGFRIKHGVGPLTLNHKMCKSSQAWADELVKRGVLEHSPGNKFGENIYCIQSSTPEFHIDGADPVNSWYKEMEYYVFGFEPYDLTSGHFTQVIWKNSTDLGVGFAKSGKRIVVVCSYHPPGNVVGEFTHNVAPLGGFAVKEVVRSISQVTLQPSTSQLDVGNVEEHIEGIFSHDFLHSHNIYRARHGCPPLMLDEHISKYAQHWADVLASKNILEHRKNCPYGESIYCMYSNDPNHKITGHTPVDTWYEEAKLHVYTKEPTTLKTGHFTQVIWKKTQMVGVGVSMSKQGYIYVVGNYSPAGNYLGEYKRNVPPPIEQSRIADHASVFNLGPIDTASKASLLAEVGGQYTTFQIDALRVHNEYRKKHGCPPLRLNTQLCHLAKNWAETCVKRKTMAHRPSSKYGENIFSMYSSDYGHKPSPRDVVKKWYDEYDQYHFGSEKINYNTLHFTQIVWKNTEEMGIDLAEGEKGYTYVVANYHPRGNVVGQFIHNVPKPLKSGSKLST